MAGISITTDNLKDVVRQLQVLSDNMNSIAYSMEQHVRNMQNWRDPQAEKFVEATMMTKKNLDLHVGNFEKMSKFLERYASMQEEAEREQGRRINNINH